MFNNSIVIYGCSWGGVSVLELLRENGVENYIKLVIDRCPENAKAEFGAYRVEKREILKEIDYDFDLIIGSMYFKQIYYDLLELGLLNNNFLKNIWVYNYYRQKPIYDEDIICIDDAEYNAISNILRDEYSKDLLKRIVTERKLLWDDNKQNIFKNILDEMMWEGDEDYWKRIKGTYIYEKNIVLDAGVYRGESINNMCNAIGIIDTYYGFEPIQENFAYIEDATYEGIKNFVAKKCALGACNKKINMSIENDESSIQQNKKNRNEGDHYEEVEMITIDSLDLHEKANYFLKMDIEGSELDALKGGEEFIRNQKPNLAICVYHKTRDIIDIPKYLLSINPNYEFYLAGGCHTILMAK